MAEVILSPLLDVIFEKLASDAMEKLWRMWGVDKELENLKSTLYTIQAVLEDAEDMQSESKAIKNWLEKLQDVAYDAEDLVDDIAIEAQQNGSGGQKRKRQVRDLFPSFLRFSNQVDYRQEMADRITKINELLDKIAKEKADFHLPASSARKQFKTREEPRQLVGSVKDESEIFGRQEEKVRIIESLLSDDSSSGRKFSVVAITGMGGQGKTTLAQLVYNDQTVISKFELRAWVCVSVDFHVSRLTKEIIESASGSSCDLSSIDALQRRLLQILNGKKYLLVLDDVWNEDPHCWDQLQGPFAFGEKGSKIVVTTRSRAVSDVMQPKRTHSLEGLSKEHCWALFRSRAFADVDEEHVDADYPRLVKIGRELVGKCQGLPLAAKALGGLLFSTRDEREWENVLKSRTWELDREGGKILAVLRLSYLHLPAHLKRCFTFCSVYPKDHKFDQQQLMKMWIAHGFVRGKDGEQIEDTGSRYFNDLVQRSFFQYSIFYQRYMMHDLVHDLAQSIAGSECFNASDSKQRHGFPKKARHLWLNTDFISSVNVDRIYELRGLRTLFFPGNLNWTNEMFNSLKFLRVLELEECDVPDSIGSLRHLRYLKIKYFSIEVLPESICDIYSLQTLILDACFGLVKLPNGTSKLSNLRHLQFDNCAFLESTPPGIGQLTCLQTLSEFIVGREEERGIEELKNLTDLRGSLQVRNLEHVQNAEAARQANLKSKSYINKLSLTWSDSKAATSIDERLEEEVAEGLQPHPNVKELSFKGYMGTHFPSWMMKSGMNMLLPNLTRLELCGCRRCSILPPLGQLPSLVDLFICDMDELKDWLGADEDEFENLLGLQVDNCPKLTKWPTKLSALSNLQVSNCSGFDSVPLIPSLCSLRISNCSQLTSLPCLPSLKQLYLSKLDNFDDCFGANEDGFRNLRELGIENCPKLTKWPTKLSPLSNLQVSYCSGFDSVPLIPSLRSLRINNCSQLTSLPCLHSLKQLYLSNLDNLDDWFGAVEDGFRNLRTLEIENCPKLTKWPTKLSALSNLRVSYCSGFNSVPLIPSLRSLRINNCSQLTSLPCLPSLKQLYLSKLDNFDDCFGANEDGFRNLRELGIENCPKLTKWPTKLSALSNLQVSYCSGFDSVPLIPSLRSLRINNGSQLTSLPCLPSLEQLYLSKLDNLDDCFGADEDGFKNLRELGIKNCPKLTKWPTKLYALSNLQVSYCSGFDSVPLIPSLRSLRINNCSQLTSLPCLPSLEQLYLSNLDNLDDWFGAVEDGFRNLRTLEIENCPKLTKWPTKLSALSNLRVSYCSGFDSVPLIPSLRSLCIMGGNEKLLNSVSSLTSLSSLSLGDLKLTAMPGGILKALTQLKSLNIRSCEQLETFLDLDDVPPNLINLDFFSCDNLKSLPKGLHTLTSLLRLKIGYCPQVQALPEEGLPTGLHTLSIVDCPTLQESCRKDTGEDWPKISHIRYLHVD